MTRWDSNPQSQQASGQRTKPLTALALGPAEGVGMKMILEGPAVLKTVMNGRFI